MINYYQWNTQELVNWLRSEIARAGTLQDLSDRLGIPRPVLREWLVLPFPMITLQQIQLISFYRDLSFDATVEWLEIKSAHMSELQKRSSSQNQRAYSLF